MAEHEHEWLHDWYEESPDGQEFARESCRCGDHRYRESGSDDWRARRSNKSEAEARAYAHALGWANDPATEYTVTDWSTVHTDGVER